MTKKVTRVLVVLWYYLVAAVLVGWLLTLSRSSMMTRILTTSLFAFLLYFASLGLTQGQITRYVSTTGTNNNLATATSWATSTTNLQGAINASVAGDQVWVAGGTYKPTTTTNRTISFSMKNGVAIYGGFLGTETDLSQRPVTNPVGGNPSSSTLSGDIGTVGSTTDNSNHVVNNPASLSLTTSAVLDGFIITGGNANGDGATLLNLGGGMLNAGNGSGNRCSPTVRNCLFESNVAAAGGAMYNAGYTSGASSPVVTNCSFQFNSTTNGDGGAMVNNGSRGGVSSPIVTNCLFQSNSATRGSGGAMHNEGDGGVSSPTVVNCSFLSNSAQFTGGAMYNGGTSGISIPRITNSLFQSNSASNGGAMINVGFSGNSSPVMINCSFQSNSASNIGGAMFNQGSSGNSNPRLTNCSFQSNSATSGGVAYNQEQSAGSSTLTLTNCVLFDNGGSNTFFIVNNARVTASYSLLDASVTGYNGGNNRTTSISPFASTTGTALKPCAWAINAGSNSAYTTATGPTTDLAGNPRIFPSNGIIDMGAYEFQELPSPPTGIAAQPAAGSAVCPESTVTAFVSASGTGPFTYQWYKDNLNSPVSNQTSATLTLTNVQTSDAGSYSVVVTGFCNAVTSTAFSLSVNTPPATLSSATLTCAQTSVTLTAGGGNSYTLSDGQTNSTGRFVVSTPGDYTVTVSNTTGCTATATGSVASNTTTPANASLTSGTLTCANPSIQLTASATGSTSYTLSDGQANSTGRFTVSTPGNYTVTISNAGGCTATATSNVATDTAPPTNVSLTSGTLTCANSSVRLIASSTGGTSYALSDGQSNTTGEFVVSTPGTYTVTARSANGCPASATATVISQTVATGATRLYVDVRKAGGGNTGLDWDNAFPDLQQALNYSCSQSLTEIWVAGGTYKPTSTTARTISFAMKNGIAIYGGFTGNETNLSQRPVSFPGSTTLSGDIGTAGNNTDNSYHVISNPAGLNNTAVLDGFVITGGNANGTSPDNVGGGMYNRGTNGNGSSPTMRNCSFETNLATTGGAIYNVFSSPVLTNCSFESNSASSGGAIYNINSSNPRLINCSFQSNSASSQGGAIHDRSQSSPVLTNCSFQGNSATSGGAIYNFLQSNPVLTNCVVFSNGGSGTFANAGSNITASYSLFDNTVTGYSSSTTNLTTTVTPFASTAGTQLAPGAPAIDAGSNTAYTTANGPATDLAGNPRIYPANGTIDMGAYEFGSVSSLTLAVQASPNPVCAGSTVGLSVNASGGTSPYSYTWAAPAGITLSATSTSAVSASVGAGVSGVQTVTITVSSSGSSPTSTSLVSLTVNAPPTATLSPSSSTLTCSQTSVTLTASGGTSYSLSDGQTNETGEFVVSRAGSYTVTVSNASGCTATATSTVSSNTTAPTATLTASSTSACAPASITLTAGGGSSYTFSAGATQIGTSNQAIVTQSGSYTVTVSNASGCTATASVSVTVNTPPAAPALTGASRTVTQSNTPLPLGQFVQATNGNTLSFSGVNGALDPPNADIRQPGQQSFSVTQTDGSGCVSPPTPFTITVQQSMTTATPGSQTVCRSSRVVLTATTVGVRYEWYKNGQSVPFRLTEIASIQKGTATSSLTLVSIQTTASYYCKVFQANGSFTFDGPFVVTVDYSCVARMAAADVAEVVEVPLSITLAPNPLANGQLRAVVQGAGGQSLSVELVDLRGRSVRSQTWAVADADQRIDWDLTDRPRACICCG